MYIVPCQGSDEAAPLVGRLGAAERIAKPTLVLKVGFLFMWGVMNRKVGGYRKSAMKATVVASIFIALIFALVGQAFYALPAAAQDQELLENRGFEQGESPWAAYGGSFCLVESPAHPVHSGSFAAKFSELERKGGWVYQDVAVVADGRYTLRGYAVKNDPRIYQVYLRISWLDETKAEISWQDSLIKLTQNAPGYCFLEIVDTLAPSNAWWARVKLMVEQWGNITVTDIAVYFDDLSFSGPKPGANITLNLIEGLALAADVTLAAGVNLAEDLALVAAVNLAAGVNLVDDLNLVAGSSEAETDNGQMAEGATSPISTSGQSLLVVVLVPTLAFMSVVCLILGFWLKRRGR